MNDEQEKRDGIFGWVLDRRVSEIHKADRTMIVRPVKKLGPVIPYDEVARRLQERRK